MPVGDQIERKAEIFQNSRHVSAGDLSDVKRADRRFGQDIVYFRQEPAGTFQNSMLISLYIQLEQHWLGYVQIGEEPAQGVRFDDDRPGGASVGKGTLALFRRW